MPTFSPPSVSVRKSRLHTVSEGQTLLREAGVWSLVRYPQDDRVEAAERAYRGGYTHYVTEVLADELEAAGYTVVTYSDVFTDWFEELF